LAGVAAAGFGDVDDAAGFGLHLDPIGGRRPIDEDPIQILLGTQIAYQFEAAVQLDELDWRQAVLQPLFDRKATDSPLGLVAKVEQIWVAIG